MLKFKEINFEKIIANKMKEDQAEYLTVDEIIENGDEDTEFLLSMLPLTKRKIPTGYILNPIGTEKIKELFKSLEPIISNSDPEYEVEIKAATLDYDALVINIKCDNFVITHNQKPNFLKILSFAETIDIYPRTDGKMMVAIEINDCLMPIFDNHVE